MSEPRAAMTRNAARLERARTFETGSLPDDLYSAIDAESRRAHRKFGDTSVLLPSQGDSDRLAVVTEELGEVARVLNERRHGNPDATEEWLLQELIQLASTAADWAWVVRNRRQLAAVATDFDDLVEVAGG